MTTAPETTKAPLAATQANPCRAATPPPEISLTSVFTAATWLSCIAVGVIGIAIPYSRPQPPKPQIATVQAELINVALTSEPIADESPAPPINAMSPPPAASQPMVPASAPALIPVAAPNAVVAFALPVAGPAQVVEARNAAYSTPKNLPPDGSANQLPVAQLTFGRGEGKQPAPTYPHRALSEGQEGTVTVEFTVGTDGRTLAAEVSQKSPWPLLNESALKVVRERWHFTPGSVRRYSVPIHFQIRK